MEEIARRQDQKKRCDDRSSAVLLCWNMEEEGNTPPPPPHTHINPLMASGVSGTHTIFHDSVRVSGANSCPQQPRGMNSSWQTAFSGPEPPCTLSL